MQTSISANGSEVSFTPDATSGGTLIATITLSPCGYTETRSFAINRRIEAPSFSPTNRVSTCTSTATLAINPICGAIDYTYTISGSLGVVFTSYGLQTLTTTNSYADLSFSGSPSSNTLKAKANYPNNNSSSEVSTKINYGAVAPGPISFPLIDPEIGRIQALIDEVPGATSYNWYKNGVLVSVYHGTFAQIPISRTQCNIEYDISVEAITCGTTSLKSHANAYVPCYNYYTVSPNPATDDVTISTDESKKQSINTTFSEVRIFDFSGNLKKSRKYNKVKSATVNVSDLKNGNYTIEIIEEGFSEKKQLLIQR
jgi:hypothetical protein